MLDVGTQSPNLLGHTLAPFWFFSPKSLDALMCPLSGLLFQKRPGSEQSLGYHQETETRGEWKVARNEIPGFSASDQARGKRQESAFDGRPT